MQDQSSDVTWSPDGVPVSSRFDDPYFSLENGLEEARHVFLRGNGLPERFQDWFHVAELGFGTGLNFLTTVLAWRASGMSGGLRFTSFEAFPLSRSQMAKSLSAFSELSEVCTPLIEGWSPEGGVLQFDEDIQLTVLIGDAQSELQKWQGLADAWYLDGFSPAKNPDLWSETILHQVAEHTAPGGTFATYTAAGFVRRSLAAAGFDVSRSAGFGRKRHMSSGVLRP